MFSSSALTISSVAVQYAIAAARRDERAALFIFDERLATLYARTRALGIELERHVSSGHVTIQQIDPAEMGPGEFGTCVRRSVDTGFCFVVIDSLNGYQHAVADETVISI